MAKGCKEIIEVIDASKFDFTSRIRRICEGEIVIFQNKKGFFAVVKVIDIQDDGRNDEQGLLIFKYKIQINGSGDFSKL